MSFLVYEQDPFVCSDICETLASDFPDMSVTVIESFGALVEHLRKGIDHCLFVLSLSGAEISRIEAELAGRLRRDGAVLIAHEKPVDASNLSSIPFLQKPFNTDRLVAVINDGFFAQHASRLQKLE